MDTIGHDDVRQLFDRTLARERLASTYLFVGPEGIGKRTFARELACGLLCAHAVNVTPCGDCESCRLLAGDERSHPDLLAVSKPEGKSTMPVDLFIGPKERRNREGLCHDIALKPFVGRRRVAIIDDADFLSVESANSLLKTLEEPPPGSVLILIGTALSRQLPTIRSRSQVVRFTPLSADEVERVLMERAITPEGASASELARLSRGSVSRALEAAESSLADFRQPFTQAIARQGFDPIALGAEVLDRAQRDTNDAAMRRSRMREVFAFALEHDRAALRESTDDAASADRCLRRLDHTLEMVAAVDRNANLATVVQRWLTGLAQIS